MKIDLASPKFFQGHSESKKIILIWVRLLFCIIFQATLIEILLNWIICFSTFLIDFFLHHFCDVVVSTSECEWVSGEERMFEGFMWECLRVCSGVSVMLHNFWKSRAFSFYSKLILYESMVVEKLHLVKISSKSANLSSSEDIGNHQNIVTRYIILTQI